MEALGTGTLSSAPGVDILAGLTALAAAPANISKLPRSNGGKGHDRSVASTEWREGERGTSSIRMPPINEKTAAGLRESVRAHVVNQALRHGLHLAPGTRSYKFLARLYKKWCRSINQSINQSINLI